MHTNANISIIGSHFQKKQAINKEIWIVFRNALVPSYIPHAADDLRRAVVYKVEIVH